MWDSVCYFLISFEENKSAVTTFHQSGKEDTDQRWRCWLKGVNECTAVFMRWECSSACLLHKIKRENESSPPPVCLYKKQSLIQKYSTYKWRTVAKKHSCASHNFTMNYFSACCLLSNFKKWICFKEKAKMVLYYWKCKSALRQRTLMKGTWLVMSERLFCFSFVKSSVSVAQVWAWCRLWLACWTEWFPPPRPLVVGGCRCCHSIPAWKLREVRRGRLKRSCRPAGGAPQSETALRRNTERNSQWRKQSQTEYDEGKVWALGLCISPSQIWFTPGWTVHDPIQKRYFEIIFLNFLICVTAVLISVGSVVVCQRCRISYKKMEMITSEYDTKTETSDVCVLYWPVHAVCER